MSRKMRVKDAEVALTSINPLLDVCDRAIASKCLSRALLTTIYADASSVLLPNASIRPSSTVRRLF